MMTNMSSALCYTSKFARAMHVSAIISEILWEKQMLQTNRTSNVLFRETPSSSHGSYESNMHSQFISERLDSPSLKSNRAIVYASYSDVSHGFRVCHSRIKFMVYTAS
jgi:hypothetical protein